MKTIKNIAEGKHMVFVLFFGLVWYCFFSFKEPQLSFSFIIEI